MNDALRRLLRPYDPSVTPPWLDLPDPRCESGRHTDMGSPCPGCIHEERREAEAEVADRCEHGHPLHDLALDHLLRCRRCVSEGRWAA